MEELGQDFGYGLTEQEVNYLINHEWARTADDVLFRRTKVGYHFNNKQIENLESYIEKRIRTDAKPSSLLESAV